jgi:hypothetical protein
LLDAPVQTGVEREFVVHPDLPTVGNKNQVNGGEQNGPQIKIDENSTYEDYVGEKHNS